MLSPIFNPVLSMSRIPGSCFKWAWLFFLNWPGVLFAGDLVLPQGDYPVSLRSSHFPDRIHEFIWRNWNAVEPERIAGIIGTSSEVVKDMAESMGLAREPDVSPDMLTRGYITLIRRNWHLLPYDQLLQLIEMSPEQLAIKLREEDFLWIKLGSLKPACEPIRYHPPDEAAQSRAAEIRRVVSEEFGDELYRQGEPRFDFVKQLSTSLPGTTGETTLNEPHPTQRIVYSYLALYGDPLMTPELNPYPDGLLQRLSINGINGIWIHVLLRDLAPGGNTFPEFGNDHQKRLANLRILVDRSRKYGISVFLYMNEPRAMPSSFFKNRSEIAGVQEGEFHALCTSHPLVRQWMADALTYVFHEVPGLGGIYAITASENLTNCASHGEWETCSKCQSRSEAEIISEVITTIEEGVHRGNPQAKVLISDWGWCGHGDAREIISRLPESIVLMSVSEWNLPIERGGIQSSVGEYSISSVGPGPRSLAHWKTAHEKGIRTGAEIQFNNTCEIATVPYLPVMELVAEHYSKLQAAERLDALLIGWTMGGHPSPNLEVARRLSLNPGSSVNEVLNTIAVERFGPGSAPHVRKAWSLMSEAFREYPFHVSVVYTSPVQTGPANLLFPEKTGYKATMWGIPYDDLESWRGPYPPEVFINQFEKVANGWQPGILELQTALKKALPERRQDIQADLRYAQAAAIHFQSAANQARYIVARDTLAQDSIKMTTTEITHSLTEIRQVLMSEIDLAHQLYTLVQEDSRIGFEPTCQYFYLPLDLVEKVINCRWLLDHYSEQLHETNILSR